MPSLDGLSSEIASLEWPSITKENYSYLNLSLNPHIVNGQLNSMPDLWDVLEAFRPGRRLVNILIRPTYRHDDKPLYIYFYLYVQLTLLIECLRNIMILFQGFDYFKITAIK